MQINRQSYEEYFLLYADGELNESEKKAVEEFIDQNPDLAAELSIIQETVVKPDGTIVFENKELLFRNESENRKVFYMGWFRIAAAAAIIIAISLMGWFFLGDKNKHNDPIAVVKRPEIKNTEPAEAGSSNEEKSAPAQQQQKPVDRTKSHKNIPPVVQSKKQAYNVTGHTHKQENINPENRDVINEPEVAKTEPVVKPIEGAAFTQGIAVPEPGKETIDVAVEPRAMDNNKNDQPHNDVSYAQSFPQEQDDDMIYFANTSLSKKTKLRGVLRKATRYLDRVTSLQ
jgi:hypothetical protein